MQCLLDQGEERDLDDELSYTWGPIFLLTVTAAHAAIMIIDSE